MAEVEEGNDEIDLHEHLKNLIEASTMKWKYAILWQLSKPQRVWKFQSGYYRGSGKAKEIESELFFKISEAQSFGLGEDLPGHACLSLDTVWVNTTDANASTSLLGMMHTWGAWERTKLGQKFWIRTFLCIPMWKETRELVLELASTQIIPYDSQWLQHMADFIHPIGTPHLLIDPLNRQDLWNRRRVFNVYNDSDTLESKLRNKKRLHEREDNVMQNRGNNNTSEPSQDKEKINDSKCSRSILTKRSSDKGKEKISDSKCSWSILTESSDIDTDTHGTFSCSNDYSGPSRVLVSDFYAHE